MWNIQFGRVGHNSIVGIVTHYGQDGLGIKSWWERDCLHLSRLALRPTQHPVQWVPDLFPGGKTAWAWCLPHIPSSTKVRQRVELYFSSSSEPSQTVLRLSLPLLYGRTFFFFNLTCYWYTMECNTSKY
jgi:hypothetical protein